MIELEKNMIELEKKLKDQHNEIRFFDISCYMYKYLE